MMDVVVAKHGALLLLPRDTLLCVCRLLTVQHLTSVALTCHDLHDIAVSDDLWRLLFAARYAPIVADAFGGACPPPPLPLSWRAHYHAFSHSWMRRAKDVGRTFMAISGRAYDVSDYWLEDHPGGPTFVLSAAGTDATSVFALAGHSDNAHNILSLFHLPSLDDFVPQASSSRHCSSAPPACGRACSETGELARAGGRSRPSSERLPASLRGMLDALHALYALARSARGRQQLVQSIGQLVHAALIDMERRGRDGKDGVGTIQKLTPVAWHLASAELSTLADELTR
jgi:hypothetical protein